jgi:hypothetical protein
MIGRLFVLGAGACVAPLAGCGQSESTSNATGAGAANSSSIVKEAFGKAPDGQAVDVYTLKNAKGAEARIMTYGGIMVSLKMPDKSGAIRRCRAGLRQAGRTTPKRPLLWGAHRPLRQPHRQGPVRPGRQDQPTGGQQQRQHPARRRQGLSTRWFGRPLR